MLWGMLTSASEWAFRAPVLLERVDLAGRTIVLTGGTDGMGAAAARELARSGARVVLGARNLSKAELTLTSTLTLTLTLALALALALTRSACWMWSSARWRSSAG